ncbi:MAG: patatin-like phospholipase family protein [Jhaorihella sp.]
MNAPGGHGPRSALVLQGGGARGAYQVGALKAIAEIAQRRDSPFQIVCGASVGAINAAPIAAASSDFGQGVDRLERLWRSLRSGSIYDARAHVLLMTGARWFWTMMKGHFGINAPCSLFDNTPLRRLLEREFDPSKVGAAIREGTLHALCITASSYDEGKAVTFFEGHPGIGPWERARRRGERAAIGAQHLMASSALPFVFPPEHLEGGYFGDGSLRLTAPLAPAIHSGAERLLVVAARDSHTKRGPSSVPGKVPTIGEMAGHALDILFNDTLDADHERLTRVNETLSLLTPEARAKTPLKVIETMMLSPSQDLRDIAQDHATEMPVVVRHLLRSVGSWGSDGRLLSYLLFEPGYIGALIDLGYADTMNRAGEIGDFLRGGTPRDAWG